MTGDFFSAKAATKAASGQFQFCFFHGGA